METTPNPFRPTTQQELLALAVSIANPLATRGTRPEVALRYGLLAALLFAVGVAPPAVISAARTHAEQKKLHELGRPTARYSWHTRGLALDVDTTNPSFPIFAALWKLLGGRDGREFETPDPGHLDFPIAELQPDASY